MNCGAVADGCGGLVDCSGGVPCPSGTTCGGGGLPNQCGAEDLLPDGGVEDGGLNACAPIPQATACAALAPDAGLPDGGTLCGIAGDGCGNMYNCGANDGGCIAPQTCGGGGTPSVCGGTAGCVPTVTACPSSMNCGGVGDGCGGLVYCGPDAGTSCPGSFVCGGGGQTNVCGSRTNEEDGAVIDGGLNLCVPISQSAACQALLDGGAAVDAGLLCGIAPDGCGNTYNCGANDGGCIAPASCGGGGTPSVCGGAATCIPKTSCPSAMNCGYIADGCGDFVACGADGGADAGACPSGELCGGGGVPNQCGARNVSPDGGIVDGGLNVCKPIPETTACAALLPDGGSLDSGLLCGSTGDGCGNVYNCGPHDGGCTAPATCGGGGVPSECGQSCFPITTCPADDAGVVCGSIANGCGGTIACATCTLPETCGGGGVPFHCGQPTCVPAKTCPSNITCGSAGDGCGGVIDGGCGTCTSPDTCGGGGDDGGIYCGHPACKPITSCPAPANCGSWPNGCGGTLTCGTNDGGCEAPQICGGSGTPSVCGAGLPDGGLAACEAGLLCDVDQCDGGSPTVLEGTIYDPAVTGVAGTWPNFTTTLGNPLYNVVVYVPNSAPSALSHGQPSCASCSSLYTGDSIVAATTDTKGNFVLTGVPVPTASTPGPWGTLAAGDVPIVIQIGKWRREWVWPGVSKCSTNVASHTQEEKYLHLPGLESTATPSTTKTNDDLPEIAISTGGADTMECLFDRIGFDTSEYACGWNDGGTGGGHLHIFQGAGGGRVSSCGLTSAASLWDSDNDLNNYDILVLSCEGAETDDANPSALLDFTTAGGRAFASHFHYSWFTGAPGYSGSKFNYSSPSAWGTVTCDGGICTGSRLGTWYPGSNDICPEGTSGSGCQTTNSDSWVNATISPLPDGGPSPLDTWLGNVGALGVDPTGNNEAVDGGLNIQQSRMNVVVSSPDPAQTVWITPNSTNYEYAFQDQNSIAATSLPTSSAQYFSFNTPIDGTGDAGAPYCGRIVYSDLHIGGASGDQIGKTVPGNCQSGVALSPQEKALEYMLLDLSSCVNSNSNLPTGPTCTPLTCAGVACGQIADGCGGIVDCPNTCEGGADCVGNQCVSCVPQKACPVGVTCGVYPDGCGGDIQCGTCDAGTCVDGTCKLDCDAGTCASQGITCGLASDGCGHTIGPCGNCSSSQACVNGTCVTPCNPVTCSTLGLHCGPAGDGCGGQIDGGCGNCTTPGQTCGGGGTPGVCGEGDANLCVPLTCAEQGIECGPAGDGCGNLIQCGECEAGTCGGGGTPGKCGSPNCTPVGCGSIQCGSVGDGCGGVQSCGTCTPPEVCGGGGTPGVCGLGDANACVPLACPPTLKCGETGDGCGNFIDCGDCSPPATCGGGGTPGTCGSPSCTKIGCGSLHCGTTGDGCGGTQDCGDCTPPETCGGGGVTGVCGQADANACVPLACPPSLHCGIAGDGCGGTINCGTCTPPLTCGGGGVPGSCGAPNCTPATCASLAVTCGQVADGCGGLTANCGTCSGGATCGGGGVANQCGSPNCTPRTCAQAGANCGPVADGCGGLLQCGTCTPPDTCGGGGTPSVCGAPGVK
jgi:hypothetical protein